MVLRRWHPLFARFRQLGFYLCLGEVPQCLALINLKTGMLYFCLSAIVATFDVDEGVKIHFVSQAKNKVTLNLPRCS